MAESTNALISAESLLPYMAVGTMLLSVGIVVGQSSDTM